MKKSYLFVFAIMLIGSTINAQDNVRKASLLFHFEEISVPDTNNMQQKKYDLMGLEVGKSMSRFYSIAYLDYRKSMEEQFKKTGTINLNNSVIPKNKRGKDGIIYKDYSANQITIVEKLGAIYYKYQEQTPVINWKIHHDTLTIANYQCQKATCEFKGRSYEAWFTSDINVNDGPWKFTGLPGLVLKVNESRGHFAFECKKVEKIEKEIELPNAKAQTVSKEQFVKLNKQFIDNPMPFMGDGQSSFKISSDPSSLPKRFYNPMELTEK